jgi:hypothetical protein
MFPDMVYGRAYKPFVYRALLPAAVRTVAEITPQSVKDKFESAVQNKRMVSILGWEKEYLYEYFVALIIMFCCFLAFCIVLRYLIKLFFDFPSFVAELAPVGGLLILPVFFKYYSYIYDPATLLLFTLAVILVAKRKFLLFYIIFILATLNKETSILLTGVFFMREFKVMRNRSLVRHLVVQISVWIGVKAWITSIFKDNSGPFWESHLIDHNLALISKPHELFYFVIAVAAFAILLHYKWAEKPVFLRRGFFITIIPLMLLALFFGYIDELRGYYEAFPFLFLLSLPTIVDIYWVVT